MKKISNCPYQIKARKERLYFILFAVLSLFMPIVAQFDLLRPENEDFGTWFQRSGSTMVVFALFSEMRAYNMLDVFKPAGIVGNTYEGTKEKYLVQAKIINLVALTLIVIGTIIWGYGDILIKQV